MKKYNDRDNTPLRFHNFLKNISFPLSLVYYSIMIIYNLVVYGIESFATLFIIDYAFMTAAIVLIIIALHGLSKWKYSAWKCTVGLFIMTLTYNVLYLTILTVFNLSGDGETVMDALQSIVISPFILVYYFKRKALFSDSALQTFEVVTFDEKEEKLRKETREIDTIKFSPEKFADNGTYYAIVTVKEGKRLRTYCTKDELKKQIESTKAKKKFCQKCGTELLQDGSFCHKCGSVMGQVSDQCNNKYQKYETCIFNAESKTLSKENIEIDIIKFPPEKFADNGTYYAIRTIKDGKKVRIYYPKSVWDKKIESHL